MFILYWLCYYALHSFLAAEGIKRFVQQHSPFLYRRYRLWYSVVAMAGLLLLLCGTFQMPGPLLFRPVYVAGIALLVAGGWITVAAFRNYDAREFFGLSQGPVVQHTELHTGGLNAWVRHPLYSGALCLAPGVALCFPYAACWEAVAALLLYLPAGIYWEEQKLIRQFGDAYRTYRKRVKAVVPGVL